MANPVLPTFFGDPYTGTTNRHNKSLTVVILYSLRQCITVSKVRFTMANTHSVSHENTARCWQVILHPIHWEEQKQHTSYSWGFWAFNQSSKLEFVFSAWIDECNDLYFQGEMSWGSDFSACHLKQTTQWQSLSFFLILFFIYLLIELILSTLTHSNTCTQTLLFLCLTCGWWLLQCGVTEIVWVGVISAESSIQDWAVTTWKTSIRVEGLAVLCACVSQEYLCAWVTVCYLTGCGGACPRWLFSG